MKEIKRRRGWLWSSRTDGRMDGHHLPYTNSVYSALSVPRWLLASQRYVPLSVLLSVVMVNSLPSTIMRSMSGSSPPSLDHSTGSGLGNQGQTRLRIVHLAALQMSLSREHSVIFQLKLPLTDRLPTSSWQCKWEKQRAPNTWPPLGEVINVTLHWVPYGNTLQFEVLSFLWNDQWRFDFQMGRICKEQIWITRV